MTLQTILTYVLTPPVAAALIGVVVKVVLPDLWAALTKSNPALANSSMWQTFEKIVSNEVTAAGQTVVADLKASGGWSPTAASKIKSDVIQGVLGHLPADIKAFLTGQVGDVTAYVSKAVETQVALNQASGVQAKVAAAADPQSASASTSAQPASA